jgi:hypothetical protein
MGAAAEDVEAELPVPWALPEPELPRTSAGGGAATVTAGSPIRSLHATSLGIGGAPAVLRTQPARSDANSSHMHLK